MSSLKIKEALLQIVKVSEVLMLMPKLCIYNLHPKAVFLSY
jgi:hypothetical protein